MQATPSPQHDGPLLDIRGLTVEFRTEDGPVRACDDVSYSVAAGETVAVVGESGSGKSVSALAVLGLAVHSSKATVAGQVLLEGRDLLTLPRARLREIRGRDVAMVFQDPMTSLNPVRRVGWQIAEMIRLHDADADERAARARAIELLELVGVPQPDVRYTQYPHQFSGGMRQRAMIAMAIANAPKLLIADEPTTALDVTIQAQVLDILRTAREASGAACVLITHDLGVVAELADRVVVMYGGRVVETGTVGEIFHSPRHPYTVGLLASRPSARAGERELRPIPGAPPNLLHAPSGCMFHPRCELGRDRAPCRDEVPGLAPTETRAHRSRCHFWTELRA